MAIFDTVPRGQYEQAIARAERAEKLYDDLLDKYHKLRPTHNPVQPLRITPPKPDSGEAALMGAEAAITDPRVAGIADNLRRERPELSEAAVMREAKRLNDIARGKVAAPSAV